MDQGLPNFDESEFTLLRGSPEGPTLDFKRTWKDKLNTNEDKFRDLARHLIAFGNISYRTGKPCYIVYGVDNKTRDIYSLCGEFPGVHPERADDPTVSLNYLMEDGVLNPILRAMQEWIKPAIPDIGIKFGYIEDEGTTKLVAWLVIQASPQQGPYRLKKGIISRDYHYRSGLLFIRKGSNTVILSEDQVDDLRSFNEAIYLSKTDWSTLISTHRKNDFLVDHNLAPYMPFKSTINDADIEESVINALDEGKKVIAILGDAGSGKSVLLRRISYRLANRHLDENEQAITTVVRNGFGEASPNEERDAPENYEVKNIAEELEPLPKFPVPIYFPLRIDFSEIADFEKKLAHQISTILGKHKNIKLERYFNIPRSQWILLLDGLDELNNPDDRCPKIGFWLNDLPANVQVILSSRPYIPIGEVDLTLTIRHLTSKEIFDLTIQKINIEKERLFNLQDDKWELFNPDDFEDMNGQIKDWYKKHTEVWPLLANHRALSAFILYLFNVTPNRPSIDNYKVDLVKKRTYKNELLSGTLPVQKIKTDELLSTSEILGAELGDEKVSPKRLFSEESLLMGEILRKITTEMREQELQRKVYQPGRVSLDDEARMQLEQVGWVSKWNTHFIDIETCKLKNCYSPQSWEWNANIGFIKRHNYHLYHFICKLYQLYLAAEFSSRMPEQDLNIIPHDQNYDRVMELRRQLSAKS